MKIAWSWSRLETFEQCPRKFQLKNITKEIPYVENEHFKKGNLYHKYMENAVNGKAIHPDVKDPKGNLARLIGNIRSSEQFWAELEITYREDWSETSWFGKDAWLRCKLDALAINRDFAVYVDWKTGKVKDITTDQNDLMALAVLKKFPQVNTVKTMYVWLDHPTAPPSVEQVQRKDASWMEQQFCDRAELINITNESGEWPEKDNRFCKWCEATPAQCSRK